MYFYRMQAGVSVISKGNRVSSGMYFYRMQAGVSVISKKMIFVK